MSKALVPVHSATWPTQAPTARHPDGSRWTVRCESCAHHGVTGPRGACLSCGAPLLPALRPVDTPRHLAASDRFSWRGLALDVNLGNTFAELLAVMIGFLVNPLLGGILIFSMLRRKTPVRALGTIAKNSMVQLHRVWFDVSRLRGRRGLVIQYEVSLLRLIHKRLEVAVRFRGPDGAYLPGVLRRYTGDRGEALVRHVTKPLKTNSSMFPRMWMFVPLRALPFPAAATQVVLTVETVFSCAGQWLAENRTTYAFTPIAGDSIHTGQALPAMAEEVSGIEAVTVLAIDTTRDTTCGVCGDSLAGEPTARCNLCDGGHHSECWEYLGGCSTYACEGRPR